MGGGGGTKFYPASRGAQIVSNPCFPISLTSPSPDTTLNEPTIEVFYYPPEVRSMKYCCLRVCRKEYVRLVTKKYKWR